MTDTLGPPDGPARVSTCVTRAGAARPDSGASPPNHPSIVSPNERSLHPAGGRRTLLVIALVALTPIVGSTVTYFFFPRTAQTNYGKLLQVAPAPEIAGIREDGREFALKELRGKWALVHAGSGNCGPACERELYATRQARTIQGREQERVLRVWLIVDEISPAPRILQQHPGLIIVRIASRALAALPGGEAGIYLIDPRGNLVLQYPEDPDIKALSSDLRRLLNASSMG